MWLIDVPHTYPICVWLCERAGEPCALHKYLLFVIEWVTCLPYIVPFVSHLPCLVPFVCNWVSHLPYTVHLACHWVMYLVYYFCVWLSITVSFVYDWVMSCTLYSTLCVIVQANHLPYIITFVIESSTSYSILCVWLSHYLTQYALYVIEWVMYIV